MRYLTFALAKGRLANKTLELLEQVGITCEDMKDSSSRKLIFTNEELKLKFFLSKASDVPTYVEYGAADFGVVGKDTILEEGRKLYEVGDLGIGKCRMCVAGPKKGKELLQHGELIRVATKYPNIAKDYFAGPSEILVIADETANGRFIAADLLSQAEHDELASAILITTSVELAEKVSQEADEFVQKLSRKEIIVKSLENYGYILVADTMEEAVEAANEIASEHVEILTRDSFNIMTKIKNAGAIFLGEYSSEPLGDYFAGPNHVLPTNGTAKFFSPLSVDDFIKKSSIISYSREALEPIHEDIIKFANGEGLSAHANSIRVRFEEH